MSNTPNQIPEEVLKMWEDAAKKYAEQITRNITGFEYNSQLKDYAYLGYLQGRQDEWERQREEISNLRNEMKRIFYVYNSGTPDIDQKAKYESNHD